MTCSTRKCKVIFQELNIKVRVKYLPEPELMEFKTHPTKVLRGNEYGLDTGIECRKATFDFAVSRVHGEVEWKDHVSELPTASLKLKRLSLKSREVSSELEIGKFVRDAGKGFSKLQFNIEPKPGDRNIFWRPTGKKGSDAPNL